MAVTWRELDTFTRAYVECALWSSTDDEGEPLDGAFGPADIHPDTLAEMAEHCADFQSDNAAHLEPHNCLSRGDSYARAGHDFWLTRNRHGAGFWDGGWREPAATALTEASRPYGEYCLYVGDDGLIHGQ